jgi:hypothetical protein
MAQLSFDGATIEENFLARSTKRRKKVVDDQNF